MSTCTRRPGGPAGPAGPGIPRNPGNPRGPAFPTLVFPTRVVGVLPDHWWHWLHTIPLNVVDPKFVALVSDMRKLTSSSKVMVLVGASI